MHVLESGIVIAIAAHFLIGASLVWDKILLGETEKQSVINYVFWLGAISVFGCIIGAFGMRMPSVKLLIIALSSGVADLVATYFYYKALKSGEASQTLAIMGGFAPLATALLAIPLLHTQLHGMSIWGFSLMVAGGFFMFFSEHINTRKILPLVVLAAGFFGISNVLQKIAFDQLGFTTGFVFFSIGVFICAASLLVRKKWREEIFTESKDSQPKSKVGYFTNRVMSGVGSFLVAFAISRAHPALVSAISGVRYATIFLGVFLITKWRPNWLKEKFTGWTLTAKSIATALVIAGLAITGIGGNQAGSSASTAFLFLFANPRYTVLRRWNGTRGAITAHQTGF